MNSRTYELSGSLPQFSRDNALSFPLTDEGPAHLEPLSVIQSGLGAMSFDINRYRFGGMQVYP